MQQQTVYPPPTPTDGQPQPYSTYRIYKREKGEFNRGGGGDDAKMLIMTE